MPVVKAVKLESLLDLDKAKRAHQHELPLGADMLAQKYPCGARWPWREIPTSERGLAELDVQAEQMRQVQQVQSQLLRQTTSTTALNPPPITPSTMAVGRSAALKIDWAKIGTQLGLKGSTAQALQTFKKRNDDARRKIQLLSEQPQSVDFAHYRQVLKNTAVVDDIEKQFTTFQVKKYDVARQIKAIETFEAQAVKSAEQTKTKVDAELKDLEKTLKNIEEARPFEDLTVDDVVAARPEIDQRVEQLVKKGRWQVPGYKEKFGDLSVI
ncbi:hypothetical protein MBLNU459_g2975t1 [Dothideomycetes sp. NU459]